MSPEERQMLSGLFDRIRSAATGPKDPEADAFINDAMRTTPASGYVLAQTVLVQQQALEAAARRITELEAKPAAQEGGFLGNIGRSLFGGAAPPPTRTYDASAYQNAPQRPAYAPPPQQGGPWGGAPQAQGYPPQAPGYPPQSPGFAPQSGGFLHGALQTATGVAGGVLLGNALGGLLGGHGGGLFGGGGFGGGGFGAPGETVNETVNNYYDSPGGQPDSGADVANDGSDYASGGDDFSGGGGDDFT